MFILYFYIEGMFGNFCVFIGCLNCFELLYWSISFLIIEDKMLEFFFLNVYFLFMFWLFFCGYIYFVFFVIVISKYGVVSVEEIIFLLCFVLFSNFNFLFGYLKMFGF